MNSPTVKKLTIRSPQLSFPEFSIISWEVEGKASVGNKYTTKMVKSAAIIINRRKVKKSLIFNSSHRTPFFGLQPLPWPPGQALSSTGILPVSGVWPIPSASGGHLCAGVSEGKGAIPVGEQVAAGSELGTQHGHLCRLPILPRRKDSLLTTSGLIRSAPVTRGFSWIRLGPDKQLGINFTTNLRGKTK